MLFICNFVTVVMATVFLTLGFVKLKNGHFNIMVGSLMIFYVAQIVPMILSLFFEVGSEMRIYPRMYDALTDESTGYWYCLFVLTFMSGLMIMERKLRKYNRSVSSIDISSVLMRIWRFKAVQLIVEFGMFFPVFLVFLSPNPKVYLQYAYFYRHQVATSSVEYLFHNNMMPLFMFASFFFCMTKYFMSPKKYKLDVFLCILLDVWLEGKRSVLTFMLIGILSVDFLKNNDKESRRKFVKKAIFFAIVIVAYFLIYRSITGKNSTSSMSLLYTVYFDKSSSVKTAIYDKLYTNQLLEYPGQAFVFFLTFFVPRMFWPGKPFLYCKYFTAYVMNTSCFLNWNLLVNVETEFISNFGIWGVPLNLLFIYTIAKISMKSKNIYTYYLGMIFIFMYLLFGFEIYLEVIWLAWLATLLTSRVKIKV